MTDTSKTSGLIRMALMGTAFIGLTIVLIVFQPGSPRNATFEAMDEPEVVTRDAAPLVSAPQETETVAAPIPAPVQVVDAKPQAADQPTNMRDMTFSAISNLKSVTTGEAPAPGQPGSLLHSVVQRSIAKTASSTNATPTLTEITPVRTETAPPADDGTYLVRDGDTLLSIAKEVFGDTGMASEIYRGNVDIMASPDSLTPGMTLKLPVR
ncbi:LysM peptidoglycan-binding domain-containing protein [uncultured Marivita sp.]|uniref:LysM peptidoglycan-binding domain-containing protein n=1 Tax=uncultured Marivita sp. TaxID=888080 RepID=UPI0026391189|nr:LysM peptidoglycan-binding domain-containing protein [uncultured Marivita sp.]